MYNHKEAFYLMDYQCVKCGTSEILWNSRDGVTPFGIKCLKCNKDMLHTNWERDSCNPDFKAPLGSRIFIDLTPEKHREYITKRAKTFWDNESFKEDTRRRYETLEKFIDSLCTSFKPGEPDIKVVEDA